jgi:hypothetical protein
MSMFDKIVAAVTPPESDETRREARAEARKLSSPGDWLSIALDHHAQLDTAFDAVRKAEGAEPRRAAQKRLAVLLTGHSIAEESVLYPALVVAGEKAHAGMGYTEQAAAKTQMAELEDLAPTSQEYLDKLEHIRGAVTHHMYQEESSWFRELKSKASPGQQRKLTERYREEFERYTGTAAKQPSTPATRPQPPKETKAAPKTSKTTSKSKAPKKRAKQTRPK